MSTEHFPAVVLEPAAQAFVDTVTAAGGPPIYALSPPDARALLDQTQAGAVAMAPAEIEPRAIPGGPGGEISLMVVRPMGRDGNLPAVMYFHGGGRSTSP